MDRQPCSGSGVFPSSLVAFRSGDYTLGLGGFDSHCSLGSPKPQLSSLGPWRDAGTWRLG